ncbi:MAG: transglycosylase SLT domain-containing protein, partial [Anaerolineae bacterium]
LPDLRPDHPRAAEALWRVAEILEEQGDRAEAADAFVELADRYPDDPGAPEARFRAGLNRYMLGERETAAQAWQDLILWYPYDERANAARFWLGKNALEAGNAISATAYLSRTASTDPWGYYGLRAADLMGGRAPMSATTSSLLPCGSAQEQQAVLDWMASWLDREPLPNLSVPPTEVLNDPRLARGTELLHLGHFDEGRSDLEALREDTVGDALSQYHLALIFREAGLYRSSIIAAATVWRLSPADDITQIPRFLGCLVYPTYFDDLVEREAETFGFNPVTLYALLRQESLFEGFATSYAAAHGLMQVIPATGAEIAAALNWPPDYETSDLYRPFVSVRFGVWYLAQQRERFDGEIYPALAGYNGGPGNAARWWEIAGGDRDLFVEIIGFEETRAYVTRITTHHAHYR